MTPEDPFGDVQSLIAEIDEIFRAGRSLPSGPEGPEEHTDAVERWRIEDNFVLNYFRSEVFGSSLGIREHALKFRSRFNDWKKTFAESTDENFKKVTSRITLSSLSCRTSELFENWSSKSGFCVPGSRESRDARNTVDIWGKMADIARAASEIKDQ